MSEEYLQWLSNTTTNEHFKDSEVSDIILTLVNRVSYWKTKAEGLEKERGSIKAGAFKK